MSESKKKKTAIEKLQEEKKSVEEELAEAMKKQEQIEHQLRRAENRADFLKDNERRRLVRHNYKDARDPKGSPAFLFAPIGLTKTKGSLLKRAALRYG